MMDAKLKTDWVKALRSGEYRQGQSNLHDPATDSYCCLGVLCRVVGAEFGEATEGDFITTHDHVPVLNDRIISNGDAEELSEAFCKEVGISDQGGLIVLNDGIGMPGTEKYKPSHSFAQIADYIEQNL